MMMLFLEVCVVWVSFQLGASHLVVAPKPGTVDNTCCQVLLLALLYSNTSRCTLMAACTTCIVKTSPVHSCWSLTLLLC
jgi:hypothetical protein